MNAPESTIEFPAELLEKRLGTVSHGSYVVDIFKKTDVIDCIRKVGLSASYLLDYKVMVGCTQRAATEQKIDLVLYTKGMTGISFSNEHLFKALDLKIKEFINEKGLLILPRPIDQNLFEMSSFRHRPDFDISIRTGPQPGLVVRCPGSLVCTIKKESSDAAKYPGHIEIFSGKIGPDAVLIGVNWLPLHWIPGLEGLVTAEAVESLINATLVKAFSVLSDMSSLTVTDVKPFEREPVEREPSEWFERE